jgi:hypothetical protein
MLLVEADVEPAQELFIEAVLEERGGASVEKAEGTILEGLFDSDARVEGVERRPRLTTQRVEELTMVILDERSIHAHELEKRAKVPPLVAREAVPETVRQVDTEGRPALGHPPCLGVEGADGADVVAA